MSGRPASSTPTVAGMFAGIGGIETGLHSSGFRTEFLCELWQPARDVLSVRFPDVPLHDDIRTLKKLPDVDVVTAGFPCTDLSQAGRTAGIEGDQSGLVVEMFRLLRRSDPDWVLIENVRNMLPLAKGSAMRFIVDSLERMRFRWAYRVVDSRSGGVPQRRQRVLLVASRRHDPAAVLFADDAGEPAADAFADDGFGFYWTEGLRGLGWARDAVPTLKGGSTIGIPSPPAIWVPAARPGRRLVVPSIESAEQLQGFPVDWTAAVSGRRTTGVRWKLVGNAVTVAVAEWLGRRLRHPGEPIDGGVPLAADSPWPLAAHGYRGRRFSVGVSMWPERRDYRHLLDVVDVDSASALSQRAAAGFASRLARSTLRVDPRFRADVEAHADSGDEAAA